MQEDLPPALADADKPAADSSLVTDVSDFIQKQFPDLHIVDWVSDVLRKVHFGTLQKMIEHASTRPALNPWFLGRHARP